MLPVTSTGTVVGAQVSPPSVDLKICAVPPMPAPKSLVATKPTVSDVNRTAVGPMALASSTLLTVNVRGANVAPLSVLKQTCWVRSSSALRVM